MLSPDTAIKICQLRVRPSHAGILQSSDAHRLFSRKLDSSLQCHCRQAMCVLAQALSADGRCKTFDASADGYGRGEGFAVAYLNPSASSSHALAFLQVRLYAVTPLPCINLHLTTAIARTMYERLADTNLNRSHSSVWDHPVPVLAAGRCWGNVICCVLQGSAVNQDGRSSSLTAPNGPSQRQLIVAALLAAGLERERLACIAVHGTGTPLGDPIGDCPAAPCCLVLA